MFNVKNRPLLFFLLKYHRSEPVRMSSNMGMYDTLCAILYFRKKAGENRNKLK
jgi:hypothetical protein